MNIENSAKLIQCESQSFYVKVELDSEDIFSDFIVPININSKNDLILYFENECVKRFTCNHQFTVNELKENGEEIYIF